MKKESRREHNPVEAKSEEAVKYARKLAPLEELEGGLAGNGAKRGSIIIDTGKLMLPKGVKEEEEKDAHAVWWRSIDPAVMIIFVLSLVFIGFIAYLISIEPPAP